MTERNRIEGKIGQVKQGYDLDEVKAKLKDTSTTWIGATLFIANLIEFAQRHDFLF